MDISQSLHLNCKHNLKFKYFHVQCIHICLFSDPQYSEEPAETHTIYLQVNDSQDATKVEGLTMSEYLELKCTYGTTSVCFLLQRDLIQQLIDFWFNFFIL